MTFILNYRRPICGSSETLKFGIKRHDNRQVKFKLALILEAGKMFRRGQKRKLETPNVG